MNHHKHDHWRRFEHDVTAMSVCLMLIIAPAVAVMLVFTVIMLSALWKTLL